MSISALNSRRINHVLRYISIQETYYDLYAVQRIREDDVLEKISKEFFISHVRIRRILNMRLPSKAEVKERKRMLAMRF